VFLKIAIIKSKIYIIHRVPFLMGSSSSASRIRDVRFLKWILTFLQFQNIFYTFYWYSIDFHWFLFIENSSYSLVNTFRLPFIQDWLYSVIRKYEDKKTYANLILFKWQIWYIPAALIIPPSHYLAQYKTEIQAYLYSISS
jgi:hypothetical protein